MLKPDFAMTFVSRPYPWGSRELNTYSVSRKVVAETLWLLRKNTRNAPQRYPARPFYAPRGVYAVVLNEGGTDLYFHKATVRPASFA